MIKRFIVFLLERLFGDAVATAHTRALLLAARKALLLEKETSIKGADHFCLCEMVKSETIAGAVAAKKCVQQPLRPPHFFKHSLEKGLASEMKNRAK